MDIRNIVNGFASRLVDSNKVVAIGLFGNWANYEWMVSGEVDFLVVDGSHISYEFEEILEWEGILFNINHISFKSVGDVVSPELDHRLHELYILYDVNHVLSRAKEFVDDKYRSRGRVEVRTEGYLTSADRYMSRAASALTRGDTSSALVYGEAAMTPVAHLLLDVAGFPVTIGSLVWNLRRACEKLRLLDFFNDFLNINQISSVDVDYANSLLKVYEDIWDYLQKIILGESRLQVGMPIRMRRDIEYLTNPLLLQLIRDRIGVMIESFDCVGAIFYMRSWLLPLLEAYAWVVSSARGDKFDYTGLFRVVGRDPIVYEGANRIFSLINVDAKSLLVEVRELILKVRSNRNLLIDGYVG